MNAKELVKFLEDNDVTASQIAYEDIPQDLEDTVGPVVKILDDRLGRDRDISYYVMYFPKHDAYIGVTGYYTSDDGSTLEDYAAVYPTIVVSVDFDEEKSESDLAISRIVSDAENLINEIHERARNN